MIAPLRSRHRLMFLGLAVIVGPLLALALTGRPQVPSQQLPQDLTTSPPTGAPLATASIEGMRAHLAVHSDQWVLELGESLRNPDVLAYWSPESPTGMALPDQAFLLGPVSDSRSNIYSPPTGAGSDSGFLVLYSLGHQEVVATASISATGGAS